MNRYEKSITMLQSALNLLHKDCKEHAECLVEIARCKRLLAVNKKHLRGQWRQDAIEVDAVQLDRSIISDHAMTPAQRRERADELAAKALDGEVLDLYVDYKEEAIKAFVRILTEGLEPEEESAQDAPPAQKGKGEVLAEPEEKRPPRTLQFAQLLDNVGGTRLDNVLATFSLEYAESRGNLNKEQAFFYLGLYQYAVSRQSLMEMYSKATTEKHPDIQRKRQCEKAATDFSYFTSPHLPPSVHATHNKLMSSSKPMQNIHSFFTLEELKDQLPSSGAYLIIQMSDDEQYLFCGIMIISRDRTIKYHVTKMHLGNKNRELLLTLVKNLATNKMTMQKAPITIEEDLLNLERDSNEEINKLIEQLEAFFDPITAQLEEIINPKLNLGEGEEDPSSATGAKPKAPEPKKEEKKAPAKAPPKGAKGTAEAALAAYESGLPLPTSGIESVVLFLDDRLESLPFEALRLFRDVPVVARDFNMHLHVSRLKTLGH